MGEFHIKVESMLIHVIRCFALLWPISLESFLGMHCSPTHCCQVRSQCTPFPTTWVWFLLHHMLFKHVFFHIARENSSLRLCYD